LLNKIDVSSSLHKKRKLWCLQHRIRRLIGFLNDIYNNTDGTILEGDSIVVEDGDVIQGFGSLNIHSSDNQQCPITHLLCVGGCNV